MRKLSNKRFSIHLCTLFDSNFMAQGLALIQSVNEKASCQIHWTVLALDSDAVNRLVALSIPNVTIIPFENFDDKQLKELEGRRPWREICWTSAACLLAYCLKSGGKYDFVGYVDADCFFINDIFEMTMEIPDSKNIAIHEHRFSPDRIQWLPKSGRFNVGVVIGRPDTDFNKCIDSWRDQVLLRCDVNMSEGRCGDQTYLNEWPKTYTSLHIFANPGIGLAPWNLNNYKIDSIDEELRIGDNKIYFYHFHGLQFRFFRQNTAIYIPAAGYQIINLPINQIYKPYVAQLLELSKMLGLRSHRIDFRDDFVWLVKNAVKGLIQVTRTIQSIN